MTYDVFTIQERRNRVSIRAYRNDLGHVRDNTTPHAIRTKAPSIDIGIPGHFGANQHYSNTHGH